MARYAENTSVSADRSRAEIEKTLTKYGAASFYYGWENSMAIIGFKMCDKLVRFHLVMPDKNSPEFRKTPGGRRGRSPEQAHAAWEQSTRQRWRALALVVKAKLEAVESGITSFEEEFLAHILLPNQQTVIQAALPMIEQAYKTGKMPRSLMPRALLPAPEVEVIDESQ